MGVPLGRLGLRNTFSIAGRRKPMVFPTRSHCRIIRLDGYIVTHLFQFLLEREGLFHQEQATQMAS